MEMQRATEVVLVEKAARAASSVSVTKRLLQQVRDDATRLMAQGVAHSEYWPTQVNIAVHAGTAWRSSLTTGKAATAGFG